jgi:hypothetical protein
MLMEQISISRMRRLKTNRQTVTGLAVVITNPTQGFLMGLATHYMLIEYGIDDKNARDIYNDDKNTKLY